MNATEFSDLLKELRACAEASRWARGKSLREAWETCERGDWLLWLCGKMVGKKGWPTRKQLVLAACDCAELALPYVKIGETRPAQAIAAARRWALGKATIQEVRTAADAAAAAASAYAAYAYAASDAAAAAADVADVAYAAAYAAANAANAAWADTLKQCADLVRKRLKPAILKGQK